MGVRATIGWTVSEPELQLVVQIEQAGARQLIELVFTQGEIAAFLILSGLLFAIGTFGFLARRNAISMLMSIELMLNAVNLNLVAFAQTFKDVSGQIFALFVITVAAAEVGIGLAIIILIFRNRETVNLDEVDEMRW